MYDLVIRHGRVVGPDRIDDAHIAIRDGKVAALGRGGEPMPTHQKIDASGKFVLPGLIDAHAHLREPGLTHKEDFATGTKAAAAGGVTTVMAMPTDNPWTATAAQFEEKRRLCEGKAFIDFALQGALGPNSGDVEDLAKLGAISFEIFLTGGLPEFLVEHDHDLLRLLRRVAAVNRVAGLTVGSPSLVAKLLDEQKKKTPPRMAAFAAVRPPVWETLGTARACIAAAEARARIHLRQLSAAGSVPILERLADRRYVSSEVTPHNLLLTDHDAERLGPYGAVIPPLRPDAENICLQNALRRGIIDIVATDHAPHTREDKDKGRDNIWLAATGLPGLQTFGSAMLDLVDRGALALSDVVRACCEQPARLFGIYPRKGCLAVGADADLIIVDPAAITEIRDGDQYSKAGYTPFAGRKVQGRIDLTMLRGQIIAQDGRVDGKPQGRFIRPDA